MVLGNDADGDLTVTTTTDAQTPTGNGSILPESIGAATAIGAALVAAWLLSGEG